MQGQNLQYFCIALSPVLIEDIESWFGEVLSSLGLVNNKRYVFAARDVVDSIKMQYIPKPSNA